jgi:hypothetical protein
LVFREGSDNIDDLQARIQQGVSKLGGLDIGDELSVEILRQLVGGRKNTSEMVELIYGLRRGEEGFSSCFSRVGREIRKLESKGLVSRRVFGRDRPYRLTELAVANLARIGGEEKQMPLIPRSDLLVYLVTIILAVPVGLQGMGWLGIADTGTVGLFPSFCFSLGVSSYGAVRTIRRVF